jgi:hypothetical protein
MVERPRFHPTTEVVGFPARIVSVRIDVIEEVADPNFGCVVTTAEGVVDKLLELPLIEGKLSHH